MKTIKKIFNMMLAVAMLVLQIVPTTLVSAAEKNGTITIENAVVGETYSAYKILTLDSYVPGTETTEGQYIYRVAAGWAGFIAEGEEGAKYLKLNGNTGETTATEDLYVTWIAAEDDTTKQAFTQAALAYIEKVNNDENENNNITAEASKTATATEEGAKTTTVKFENLELGYYVIDSSLGSLCILTTTKPTATVKEKNTVPTVDKEVQEDSKGEFDKRNENDATIGDTVKFRSTITVGTGTENYVFYDKMSAGLTLDATSIKVYVDGVEVKAQVTIDETTTKNFEINTTATNEYTFKITFENTFIASIASGESIVVEYNAVLNTNAVVGSVGNPNEAWLTYGNAQETEHDETKTYTYDFELVKTTSDGVTLLNGAKFKLYTTKTGTQTETGVSTYIPVVYVETDSNGVKYYRVAVGSDEIANATEIEAGKAVIMGLDADKYYLEETVAPTGYNKLSERVQLSITSEAGDSTFTRVTTTVKNYTGAELPETGGIGTVLFITIGSLLVLGFGVLLVTKLRMSKIEA